MKKTLLFTFLLFILLKNNFAQPTFKPNTSVGPATVLAAFIDSKTNKPVEYVTVSLLKAKDSTLITGTTTTKKGEIKLENLPFGSYKLEARFIGYQTIYSNSFDLTAKDLVVDLGKLKMVPNLKNLNTIEINGERNDFSNQLDKKTYAVGKNITNVGGSATDILQNIPSVNVDLDGKISLRGSENVTVLIDGKPSTLSGANRQAILQQLPAGAISEVEVITNPSAKYDADGMAGIINIKTKKDKMKGFNGNVQSTIGTNDKYSLNFGINNRTSKYNLYGNYSFRHERRNSFGRGDQFNDFDSNSFSFKSTNDGYNLNDFNTGRIGIDYYINNQNTISFSSGISSNISNKPDAIKFSYFDSILNPTSVFERNNFSTDYNLTFDATTDYKKTFSNSKKELTASANISSTLKEAIENYKNSNSPNFDLVAQRNINNSNFTNFITQVDYINPSKFGKIETGLKTTIRNIENNQTGNRYNFSTSEFWKDSLISNQFIYNEVVYAGYLTFASKYKKFDYQFGVRSEITDIDGNSVTVNKKFNNNYYNFFPSGFIKYALTKNQDLQASFSRRINRPGFESLNPFTDYADSVNIRRGNPNIQPEYIQSYELNYLTQLNKLNFSTTLYYRYTSNLISRLRTIDQSTGQSLLTFFNFSSSENTGVEVIVRYTFKKLGNLMLSGNWYKNEINGSNVVSDLQSSINTWNVRFTYNLPLPKSFFFQANGMYAAPMRNGQNTVYGMMNGMDIGVRKDFLKGKLQTGLNLTDVFDNREFNIRIDGIGFTYDGMRKRESRVLTFSLTYRFGGNENPFTKKKPNQNMPIENMDMGF